MNRQERWTRHLRRQLRLAQSAGRRIHAHHVNAFALRAGVGADVDQHSGVLSANRRGNSQPKRRDQ